MQPHLFISESVGVHHGALDIDGSDLEVVVLSFAEMGPEGEDIDIAFPVEVAEMIAEFYEEFVAEPKTYH